MFLHYTLCKCHQRHPHNRVWCLEHQAFPSRFSEAETAPALCVLPTHHFDFVSLDADIRASEVAQSCDGSNAGSIHQVPIMIQHVNVHSDLPNLKADTHIVTTTINKGFFFFSCLCVCVCVLPFLQTPHTGTRYQCTWSSSSISPAVC